MRAFSGVFSRRKVVKVHLRFSWNAPFGSWCISSSQQNEPSNVCAAVNFCCCHFFVPSHRGLHHVCTWRVWFTCLRQISCRIQIACVRWKWRCIWWVWAVKSLNCCVRQKAGQLRVSRAHNSILANNNSTNESWWLRNCSISLYYWNGFCVSIVTIAEHLKATYVFFYPFASGSSEMEHDE